MHQALIPVIHCTITHCRPSLPLLPWNHWLHWSPHQPFPIHQSTPISGQLRHHPAYPPWSESIKSLSIIPRRPHRHLWPQPLPRHHRELALHREQSQRKRNLSTELVVRPAQSVLKRILMSRRSQSTPIFYFVKIIELELLINCSSKTRKFRWVSLHDVRDTVKSIDTSKDALIYYICVV